MKQLKKTCQEVLAATGVMILLLAPALQAQRTGTVSGRVQDSTGAALAEAVVRVEYTPFTARTDEAGRYLIAGVPAGKQLLIAQRIGLGPERRSIVVLADSLVTVDFQLRSAPTILPPIVISVSREDERRTDAPVTIDVLSGGELRQSAPAHPNEVMNRLPGVHLAALSGEGHMTAIRQPISTKPVYLYLEDGVPTRATGFFNHNALYEVNIPQSGGIEVLKGPGTALYGSDAIGGVVNVLTREPPAVPSAELTAEGGSDGWARALLTGGTTSGSNGVRADLNLTRTDGWRDRSGYHRQSGTIRWDHANADGWSSRTVVTASNIHQQDAYTLDQAQFEAASPINRSPISFRKVQAFRISSALERTRGNTLWSFTPYARYNRLDLIPYWQLSYDPQLWNTRNASAGLLARMRRDFPRARTRVIVGADADWSPGTFRAFGIAPELGGPNGRTWASYTTGAAQYDYHVTYRSVSPYAQVEVRPIAGLKLDAGLRYDVSGYRYDNHLTTDQSPGSTHRRPADRSVGYEHLSPKIGATLDLTRALNLYASYRNGFRAPSQQQLFAQGAADNTVALQPVTVNSYEVGIRGEAGGRFLYQASAYSMTLTNDILTFTTPENTRVAVNAGSSRYQGIELGAGVMLTRDVRLDLSFSRSRARYLAYAP
ncbi:MAG TPA: TonB-dependent receptor [Gemmatimonadales bacterium]|nr:TonB-dependent receptor [Gemmatimonadales bacterium]